jgi:tetratricopeptide (TPR) repeat protein
VAVTNTENAHDALFKAEALLQNAEFEKALEEFAAALAIDCENVEAHCGRVRTLWSMRETKQARRELLNVSQWAEDEPALRIANGTLALGVPDHPLHISIMYGSAGRDDERALSDFTAAVEMAPHLVSAWRGLATAQRLAWRIDDAHRTLDAALTFHPRDPRLRIERAWCLLEAGRFDEARVEIASVLRDTPNHREVLFVTCMLARIAFDYEVARSAVEALRSQCPDHALLAFEEAKLEFDTAALYSDPEAYQEAKRRARDLAYRAWKLSPGWPYMLDATELFFGNATAAKEVIESELFVESDRIVDPPSSTLLEIRGVQLAKYADLLGGDADALKVDALKASLEAFGECLAADPHHISVLSSEARTLIQLERLDDARHSLHRALEHSPGYPPFMAEMGWVEFSAERYETALDCFEQAGSSGEVGRISTLRFLGCFDLAEQAATNLAASEPANVYALNELALCELDEGRPFAAYDRSERVLAFEPGQPVAAELRKEAHARRRMHYPRRLWRSVEQRTKESLERSWIRYDRLDRRLVNGRLLRMRGALRELDRRQAKVGAWSKITDDFISVTMVLLLPIIVLVSPLLTFQFDAFSNSGGSYGIQVAVNIGVLFLIIIVLFAADRVRQAFGLISDRAEILALVTVTVVDAGGLVWVVTRKSDRLGDLALVGLVSLSYFIAWAWLLVLLSIVHDWLAIRADKRSHQRSPLGSIAYAMLDLLDLLDYEPGLLRTDSRAKCIKLIEQAAQSLPHALATATDEADDWRRPTKSEQASERQRAAAIVAATRDLKDLVRSPKADSWDKLRTHAMTLLTNTARGHWGELDSRTPDPVGRVFVRNTLTAVRGLAVVAVPPAALAAYQLVTHTSLANLPLALPLIAYVGWPLLSLMWWLDPNLSSKLGALRQARDLTNAKQSSSSDTAR